MNGTLALRVALTCHGNAAIAGLRLPQFFPDHSTCRFCESVVFVRPQSSPDREQLLAATPDQWLAGLASYAGVRLSLTPQNDPLISDRMSAGFVGGGGDWWIEVLRTDGTRDIWIDRWTVGNRDAPDQRIWRVRYELVATAQPAAAEPVADLDLIAAGLRQALERIGDFARRQSLDGFAQAFRRSLDCLDGQHLDPVYHHDLALAGTLPPQAFRLLRAAQAAWVFGGMGSWNDLGLSGETQVEYEALSQALFDGLREAILAATNSSLGVATSVA